ncbi:hypothetical protein C4D60_Mb03t04760 [Musa balbisiana]|uniref:Uncharacterized protein n=1 Tax=Musa balbisiana TaxID=52838 RepID=A0A4S8J7X3_MUSBA|nr:hypothetical protein C4D60_Mb03t04760 [Musa balbisiana]
MDSFQWPSTGGTVGGGAKKQLSRELNSGLPLKHQEPEGNLWEIPAGVAGAIRIKKSSTAMEILVEPIFPTNVPRSRMTPTWKAAVGVFLEEQKMEALRVMIEEEKDELGLACSIEGDDPLYELCPGPIATQIERSNLLELGLAS